MNAQDLLPTAVEAEESLLGALLMTPEVLSDVVPVLQPRDFYVVRNRWIYDSILSLSELNRQIDLLTVSRALSDAGQLADVGESYLAHLIAEAVTPYHAGEYAGMVHTAAVRRRLFEASREIARSACDPKVPAAAALADAEAAVLGIAGEANTGQVVPLRNVLVDLYAEMAERREAAGEAPGIPTGFRAVDHIVTGLRQTEMVIVAGRPGMGKSALCLEIAHRAAKHGKRVAVFSLEMSAKLLARRMVAGELGIETRRLERSELDEAEWDRLTQAIGRLSQLPLVLDDAAGMTPLVLRSKCRQIQAAYGLDLVVLDYLQLMHADGRIDRRVDEIGQVSIAVKAIAREMNVPVLAAAQLNRATEGRSGNRPQLADLRESGQLEQDADVVLLLYRDEMYNRDTMHKNTAEVIVAKQRNGPTGIAQLYFDASLTRFADLAVEREVQL